MYETKSPHCPVFSFQRYLSKLNPKCSALWQRPKDSFLDDDDVWYENKPIGKNTLGKIMANISKMAKLSQGYTNYCIRATCITVMSEAGFEARHISTISGHRNDESIKNYCRETTSEQKREMSTSLVEYCKPTPTVQPEAHKNGPRPISAAMPMEECPMDEEISDMEIISASQMDHVLDNAPEHFLSSSQTDIVLANITNTNPSRPMMDVQMGRAPFVFNNYKVQINMVQK